MTLAVDLGRKATKQTNLQNTKFNLPCLFITVSLFSDGPSTRTKICRQSDRCPSASIQNICGYGYLSLRNILPKSSTIWCKITGKKRTLVKSAQQKLHFLISQPKHMLWVLKRTVSMRRFFFEHPKHMLKLTGKKISTILR